MKLFEVQQAVFNRLNNAVTTGVFDYVPEKTPFPYIVLGEIESVPDLTKTTRGEKITLMIYIFSRFKGKEEIFKIADEIETSLADDLTINGAFLIYQRMAGASVLETEADFFQGTLKFELLIQL